MHDKPLRGLRSAAWFGKADKDGFIHRSWMRNQGLPEDVFDGRPVIGICNTWSELTPCNAHLRTLADHVKRGVYEMALTRVRDRREAQSVQRVERRNHQKPAHGNLCGRCIAVLQKRGR